MEEEREEEKGECRILNELRLPNNLEFRTERL